MKLQHLENHKRSTNYSKFYSLLGMLMTTPNAMIVVKASVDAIVHKISTVALLAIFEIY